MKKESLPEKFKAYLLSHSHTTLLIEVVMNVGLSVPESGGRTTPGFGCDDGMFTKEPN